MAGDRKIKIGLVGLGNIGGKTHVNNLRSMANLEVVGVCDIDTAKADRAAAQVGTKAYYDHTSLFERSGLEAVVIAVPHFYHTPIAIDAFARGLKIAAAIRKISEHSSELAQAPV